MLFWLSLVPAAPLDGSKPLGAVADRGLRRLVLLMPAIAYYLLQLAIIHKQGSIRIAKALGSDIKGKISPLLYVTGIVLAFFSPWVSVAIYALVAIMWLFWTGVSRTLSAASRRSSA